MRYTSGRKQEKQMPKYVERSNADSGFDSNDTFQEPFRFPFRSIIHGIAYDGNGVIIYGFFPRLIASHPNGKPSEWGFGCTVVTTEFRRVFRATPAARVKFITTMLIIQRHATYLSEELQKGLLFMKAHGACDKLWEEGRLGCH